MKEIKTKYCAIKYADNGSCEQVLECKNLTEKEYAKLKNEEIANHQKELGKEYLIEAKIELCEKTYAKHSLLIAKGIYDNFVDSGVIEDDKDFQNKWYDRIMNGSHFEYDECPELFKKIYEYVCELGEKEWWKSLLEY